MKQTLPCHRQPHRLAEFVLVQAQGAMKSGLIARTLRVLSDKMNFYVCGKENAAFVWSHREVAWQLGMHFAKITAGFVSIRPLFYFCRMLRVERPFLRC